MLYMQDLISSSNCKYYVLATVISSILQRRKLRLREVKLLAQRHTGRMRWGQGQNSGCLTRAHDLVASLMQRVIGLMFAGHFSF